jgi:hypothetical protein
MSMRSAKGFVNKIAKNVETVKYFFDSLSFGMNNRDKLSKLMTGVSTTQKYGPNHLNLNASNSY